MLKCSGTKATHGECRNGLSLHEEVLSAFGMEDASGMHLPVCIRMA
jgi:hypothetical protein